MTNLSGRFAYTKGNPYLPGVASQPGGYHFCASFQKPDHAVLRITDPKTGQSISIPMGEGAVCGARAAVFVSCPDHRTLLYSYEENGVSVKDPYAKVIRQDKTYTPPMSRKSGSMSIIEIFCCLSADELPARIDLYL